MGSGLTHAVHWIAARSPAAGMDRIAYTCCGKSIKAVADDSADKAGRNTGNLEDDVRVANEMLRGLEILGNDEEVRNLREVITDSMLGLAAAVLQSEANIARGSKNRDEDIASASKRRDDAYNALVGFLMSFASRTGTRDRLNVFTTNYDRLIEAGAELSGLHLLDRFVGTLMPVFRSSRLDIDMHYNPPGIRGEPRYLEGVVRFSKLHGSLDWFHVGDDIRRIGIPFGATHVRLQSPGLDGINARRLMVYPNAAKDQETAMYPFVELFRDFAAAICRPNSTLVTYGYSFGDDHINRVIRDMLTIPSTHLVVIARDDNSGRIMQTYEKTGRASQISLLIGPALSDLKTLNTYFLPKASIDSATTRMSEMLRRRYGDIRLTEHDDPQKTGEEKGSGAV